MITNRIIEVSDYSESWEVDYQKESSDIAKALNQTNVVAIHHIGSTSVIGLAAKPIIDILIEVHSLAVLDNDSEKMTKLDYLVKGEFGIKGRRYFQKGGIQRSHQVHAFVKGSEEVKRHIAFRDYLREFKTIVNEYGSIKKQAALGCNNDIEVYMSLKNAFIKEHEAKALLWKYS